ncbi:MAG: response regulator [Owenweeksia sp.]|nr:response regulator [Owenweeksia sp.]
MSYRLPDLSGIEVLRKIREAYAEIPVVIVSGQENVSTAVELLKEGAYDYIVKDDNAHERMWKACNNIKENFMLGAMRLIGSGKKLIISMTFLTSEGNSLSH